MKIPSWVTDENARKLLFLPPLALGVIVFAYLVASKQSPTRRTVVETSRSLRVIAVSEVDVVPRVIGHGTAEPGEVWRAIAEVRGRAVRIHERLAPGELVKAGEELLQIDPLEYELAVAQLESDIEQTTAQLAENEAKASNYQASIKIEEESLALAEKELARLQTLEQRTAVAGSEVDSKSRQVLTQRQSVQSLKNSISLVPVERRSLEAALAVKQANLNQAKLEFQKTTISAPFDCRLGQLSIEVGQFLAAGEFLFEGHSTAVTEIEAQVVPHEARTLVDAATVPIYSGVIGPEAFSAAAQLGVTVRVRSGDATAEWQGRFARLREQLDAQTRTIGIVVAVDKPYEQIIPGRRPPLVRGMYCEVELQGRVRPQRIVIPRSSLHSGHVYVVDSEKRLRRRPVEVDFAEMNFVCLRSGLSSGELLVVSDPTPAIEGLLVEAIEDDALRQTLFQEASGVGASE